MAMPSNKTLKKMNELRLKQIETFFNSGEENGKLLKSLVPDEIESRGGYTAYMNLQSAIDIFQIIFTEMLQNNVPEDVLEKVINQEVLKIIPKSKDSLKKNKWKG